jgi:AcrR family transcriptional regulator
MRAQALSPDARRASIVAAALPLLRTHGLAVTTSQIAMAAGIAEGTLFRAFPDKETLITAAIESAFDPAPDAAAIAAIDRGLELRDKLLAAVDILGRRVEQIWQLISILGRTPPPRDSRPPAIDDAGLRAALAALFEPHRGELRVDPIHAARLLRTLTFAGTHPRITDNTPLTAGEIVTLLLDGIRAREDAPC